MTNAYLRPFPFFCGTAALISAGKREGKEEGGKERERERERERDRERERK